MAATKTTDGAGSVPKKVKATNVEDYESTDADTNKEQVAEETKQSIQEQPLQDLDVALTGKTLLVYRYLITSGRPAGPRDVQRALKFSGPSVASFHLEKLARSGLVKKNESDGSYAVDRLHLKHYFLLRRRLIPKYFLYATLATSSILGWIATLFLKGAKVQPHPFLPFSGSPADFYVFIYGIAISVLFASIFWYETWQVLKNERI